MLTGIEAERARLVKLRFPEPFRSLVNAEQERQDAVRSRAEKPSEDRLPLYVRRSLRTYRAAQAAVHDLSGRP